MNTRYSATGKGFYPVDQDYGDSLPPDVVTITREYQADLKAGELAGKIICADESGFPVLRDQPPPTTEQIRAQWKQHRAAQVAAIKVTTHGGNTFDGDEESQGRMARAILGLQAVPGGSVTWVLADNSVKQVGAEELTEALALAGAEQARIWVAE